MSTRERIPASVVTGLRRGVVVALLTVVAFLGGVTATHFFPVHTQTDYFSAQISVQPRLDSTVLLPTALGNMEVTFDGSLPAPGLVGQVQIRESVTELLRQGQLRTADLEPSQQELRAAIDTAVREVAWKFAVGALVTTALVLFTYAVSRPVRLARALVSSAVATALALLVPGATAYLTYRTDNVQEFRTTSLLSLVEGNTDILAGLDRKADQGAVYVTNLLALSSAMRQEFSPSSVSEPAVRFLLVSDKHGMNHYPLMREIVQTQQIDAVIDAGDLVNFGTPEEGNLTRIYEGIESLGVPYLFVRGNHDAVSATDERLLRRLERVPNVVLLEPTAGELQLVTVGGVRVSGFNDIRYFNQRHEDFATDQADLAAAYRDRVDGLPPTDIIVTHQPYAANRVQPRAVTISGHMHVAGLGGRNIQVGSFTGGGLVNQFRLPPLTEQAREAAEEDPDTAGELQGGPQGFDILTFGEDCSVGTLTRYSYRNLVSGRPQFDDVSMVNGQTIEASPPQAGRVCSAELGVTVGPIEDMALFAEDSSGDDEPESTTLVVTPPDDAVVTTLPPLRLPEIDESEVTEAPTP
ncbi:metallophosphoesterase family protein [Ornithinimicrobium pratense]|uniref:Metallophosphoesterase n=1 Tax=Ornithinimicrobium pratense TaxID=2593973 RepID=A0A5J6V7T2_9MICO|nr:metallophosphoesterase [Ornithinimicrobium pratense]QFG69828.1 metallophosphoesterase [Ornithinimicrobium pratense]